MSKIITWEIEEHKPTPYHNIKGWDEEIVETAGFIPLEVRFKQMEQAGIRAQFFESEFGSKDFRDMYLNHPEFDLTPEDDIEDAIAKMEARAAWIQEVKNEAIRKRNSALTDADKSEAKKSESKAEEKED